MVKGHSWSVALPSITSASIYIYFGPKGRTGKTPTECLQVGKRILKHHPAFEILARFYPPEKTLYDQGWKLNDLEKVEGGKDK